MHVAALEVRNLRNLAHIKIELSPGLNLVVGPNGSGKSSLLEAVHIIGSGRSFRTYRLRDVVTRGESTLRITARIIGDDGIVSTIGVEHSLGGPRIRRDGVDVKAASELVAFLPTVTVTPDSYRLVTDGADLRRRLIDRLLFHVEPRYIEQYQRYRRALRQRNAALRCGVAEDEFGGWNAELAASGERLTALRMQYLESALPMMEDIVSRIVGFPINIRFRRGWDSGVSLKVACERSLTGDRLRGYTQTGPHRADLRFSLNGHLVQHTLSRGETKLFVTAILVAQIRDLTSILGHPPVVLVDDLASELDPDSRNRCLAELKASGAQLVLTAISNHWLGRDDIEEMRLFHVEQGRITKVI